MAQITRVDAGRMQLCGVLDLASVPALLQDIDGLDYEASSVTVDLKTVEHADSAGVALLLAWMRHARHAEREIRFLNMPTQMLNIARVSGLDEVLPLARD